MEAGRVKPPFEPDPHAVYAKVGDELASGKKMIFPTLIVKNIRFYRTKSIHVFHFIKAI